MLRFSCKSTLFLIGALLVVLVVAAPGQPEEDCPSDYEDCDEPNYRHRYDIRVAGDNGMEGEYIGQHGSAAFIFDECECKHYIVAVAPNGGSFIREITDNMGETGDLLTVKVDHTGNLHVMFHAQDPAPYIYYMRAHQPGEIDPPMIHLFPAPHGRFHPPHFHMLRNHGQVRSTPIIETRAFDLDGVNTGLAGFVMIGNPLSLTNWTQPIRIAEGTFGGGISSMHTDFQSGIPAFPGGFHVPHGAVIFDSGGLIQVRYSRGQGGNFVDLSNTGIIGRGFSPTVAIQSLGPGPMDYVGHVAFRGEGQDAGKIRYGQFSERPDGVFRFDLISSNIAAGGTGRVMVAVHRTRAIAPPSTIAQTPIHLFWYDTTHNRMTSVRSAGGFSTLFGFDGTTQAPQPFNEIAFGGSYNSDPIFNDSHRIWRPQESINQVPRVQSSFDYKRVPLGVGSYQPFDPNQPQPTPDPDPTPSATPIATPPTNPCGISRGLLADRLLGRTLPCLPIDQDYNTDGIVDSGDFFFTF